MTTLERISSIAAYPVFCLAMILLGLYGLWVGRDEFNRRLSEVFPP